MNFKQLFKIWRQILVGFSLQLQKESISIRLQYSNNQQTFKYGCQLNQLPLKTIVQIEKRINLVITIIDKDKDIQM